MRNSNLKMLEPQPWNISDVHTLLAAQRKYIPKLVFDWYADIQDHSFKGELYKLRKALLKARNKNYEKNTEFYRLLYIALCDYYMEGKDYKTYAIDFLNLALNLKVQRKMYPLICEIKYSLVNLKKTLLIVSYEEALSYNYKRLEKINSGIRVYRNKNFNNFEELFDLFDQYDQVFVLGHGQDNFSNEKAFIEVGNSEFTPGALLKYLKSREKRPAVMGIFSCGDDFDQPGVKNNLDYFITDQTKSVPEWAEMFFNGFLSEYYRSFNINSAFRNGRLATIVRARNDPGFKLYSRGYLL